MGGGLRSKAAIYRMAALERRYAQWPRAVWAPADSMGAQTARAPMLSGGPWKMFASPSNNTFRGHWGLSQDVKSGVTLRIVLRLQLHPNAKFCNPNPQFAPPIFLDFHRRQ